MNEKRCEDCYYNYLCHSGEVCGDYAPVNEHSRDNEIYDMIEQDRIAFRAEWFRYTEYRDF